MSGDGTGEGLVRAYYNCVGWPTFLPSNEQEAFAGKVYSIKQQQMKLLIKQASIPLRDGVVQVFLQPPTDSDLAGPNPQGKQLHRQLQGFGAP